MAKPLKVDLMQHYKLIKSKRKTLEISISADKEIIVKAPRLMPNYRIEYFVSSKKDWIDKQLRKKNNKPKRQFINNELHSYLGEKYPIQISNSSQNIVELVDNKIHIQTINTSSQNIESLLYHWYRKQAKIIFVQLYQECWQEFSDKEKYQPPTLTIKRVKTIWGSLSSKNNMNLNLELIRYPKICIKYIIFHELCHLVHKNHGSGFKELLTHNMTNWKEIKHILNKSAL